MTDNPSSASFFGKKMTVRQFLTDRKTVGPLLVIAIVLVGLGAARVLRNPTNVQNDKRPTSATVTTIALHKSENLVRATTYSGSVVSLRDSKIGFQRGGQITELHVDEGDQVVAGQSLAFLDHRIATAQLKGLQARKAQAAAVLDELNAGPRKETVDAARSNVEDLTEQHVAQEKRLTRAKALVEQNAISDQDYEAALHATNALSARLNLAIAQFAELEAGTRKEKINAQVALVDSLQAEIEAAEAQLDDCQLTAPFHGTIVARHFDEGAVVASGTPVFEIVDQTSLEIHVGLPEDSARSISPGVSVPLDSDADSKIEFTVKKILPRIDNATRTRKAILEIASEDAAGFVPGQIVPVKLTRVVPNSGYWIPATSITSSQRGIWVCYTVEPSSTDSSQNQPTSGVVRKHTVKVLYRDDDKVFVSGTLHNSQLLIAEGMHKVVPGDFVSCRMSEWISNANGSIDATESAEGK